MPANEKLTGAESASVTKTKAVKTKIAGKFKAGDKIKLPCVVVNVTDTEITLEVEDGVDGSSHRITLSPAQNEALK